MSRRRRKRSGSRNVAVVHPLGPLGREGRRPDRAGRRSVGERQARRRSPLAAGVHGGTLPRASSSTTRPRRTALFRPLSPWPWNSFAHLPDPLPHDDGGRRGCPKCACRWTSRYPRVRDPRPSRGPRSGKAPSNWFRPGPLPPSPVWGIGSDSPPCAPLGPAPLPPKKNELPRSGRGRRKRCRGRPEPDESPGSPTAWKRPWTPTRSHPWSEGCPR